MPYSRLEEMPKQISEIRPADSLLSPQTDTARVAKDLRNFHILCAIRKIEGRTKFRFESVHKMLQLDETFVSLIRWKTAGFRIAEPRCEYCEPLCNGKLAPDRPR